MSSHSITFTFIAIVLVSIVVLSAPVPAKHSAQLATTSRATLAEIKRERKAAQQKANRLTLDSVNADRKKTHEQVQNHIFQARMEAIADAAKKQAAAANAFSFE